MGSIWSVSRPLDFLWRVWADEAVVYDCLRGDTHMLEPFAATLFGYLNESPKSVDDLVHQLQGDFVFGPEQSVAELSEATLAKLQGIDLVMMRS